MKSKVFNKKGDFTEKEDSVIRDFCENMLKLSNQNNMVASQNKGIAEIVYGVGH